MSPTRLRRLAGVRRTDETVDLLEQEAEKLGWRCYVLDGTDVESRRAFLDACVETFELPEWFGMNWDALDEALGDLELADVPGVVVLWPGWGEFAEAAPRDFAVALDVLHGAVRTWAGEGEMGGVLLLGEGPDDVEVEEF
jgi:hypothetical protein